MLMIGKQQEEEEEAVHQEQEQWQEEEEDEEAVHQEHWRRIAISTPAQQPRLYELYLWPPARRL